MTSRADTREAADALRRLLTAVERGEVTAHPMERHAIAGAVLTLDAQTARPARPTRRPRH